MADPQSKVDMDPKYEKQLRKRKQDAKAEADKRKQAEERLRGQLVGPSTGRDLSRYERDATAD